MPTTPRIRREGQNLYYQNGVFMGEILADVDGFYKWWPWLPRAGYIDGPLLQEIADLLAALNKPWQETMDKELGGSNANT